MKINTVINRPEILSPSLIRHEGEFYAKTSEDGDSTSPCFGAPSYPLWREFIYTGRKSGKKIIKFTEWFGGGCERYKVTWGMN